MENNAAELLPCPFCGGKGEMTDSAGLDADKAFIQCQGCWVCTTTYDSPDEAVAVWNRRPSAGQE